MNGTTYLSASVLEQLDHAQTELERHLVSTPGGRCRTCGEEEPCPGRIAASQTFVRFGRLPRRAPGEAGKVLLGRNR